MITPSSTVFIYFQMTDEGDYLIIGGVFVNIPKATLWAQSAQRLRHIRNHEPYLNPKVQIYST